MMEHLVNGCEEDLSTVVMTGLAVRPRVTWGHASSLATQGLVCEHCRIALADG